MNYIQFDSCNNCKEIPVFHPEENVYMPEIDYCDQHDPDLDPNDMYSTNKEV